MKYTITFENQEYRPHHRSSTRNRRARWPPNPHPTFDRNVNVVYSGVYKDAVSSVLVKCETVQNY